MRGELSEERQAVAAANLLQPAQWRGLNLNLGRKWIVPWQRRMPQRSNSGAVPPELPNVQNDRAAG